MKQLIFLQLFVFAALGMYSQKNAIVKEKWHFDNPEKQSVQAGYAQVVKVGNVLYISGAVARDITPDGIRQVYKVLEQSLSKFGATFQNVVKENLYVTDIEEMKKHNEVRKTYYNNDFPAATWVQISRLYMADAKLEVELIAHLPE